jgi:hypothetical protein
MSCKRKTKRYYCYKHIIPALISRGRRLIRRYIEKAKPMSKEYKEYIDSVTIE